MDLILTLDRSHDEMDSHMFSTTSGAHLQAWALGLTMQISRTPTGIPKKTFERAFEEISRSTEEWIKRIK